MKFSCPHCQKKYDIEAAHPGKKVRCKQCQKVFQIPPSPASRPVKSVVPFDSLPAPKPDKRANNILLKLWTGTPSAYRTSFLATLGVLSALLVAFYVFNFGGQFLRASKTDKSQSSVISKPLSENQQRRLIVAALYLSQEMGRLEAIQSARAALSSTEFILSIFQFEPVLEEMYHRVNKNNNVCEDAKYAHEMVLYAIRIEYEFLRSGKAWLQNADDLRYKSRFTDYVEKTQKASSTAAIEVVRLYSLIDSDILLEYQALQKTD